MSANQRRQKLRLIQFRAAYNLPVHAAMEYGIFASHGLEVEATYTPGSDFLIAALEAGQFEIGHPAADDVVAAVEGKTRSDLFLFMGLHSGLMSVVAGEGYRDVESLRGQSLGVDSRSTGFVFLLDKFLRANGLGPEDYTLIEVGGWERRYSALLEKRIAATLLTSPYVEDALESGCHLLARGDGIEPVYQATCGAAVRRWARENQEALVNYIRAYVAATQWCFDRANRHACLRLLNQHAGLNETRAEKTLAALLDPLYGLYPRAEPNIPGITAVLALRAETGRLKSPVPPVEKYLDISFYLRAHNPG
ncbi:MAG TPA: ABC transporter substrate-binding protein [Candidatus Binatia bacterium]|jgi:ABC-type nitrate/sulfonate/bicarbonate transport system substrate-binding protein